MKRRGVHEMKRWVQKTRRRHRRMRMSDKKTNRLYRRERKR